MEKLAEVLDSLKSDEFITIEVGDTGDEYKLPKSVLCAASNYFVNALDESFQEAKTRPIKPPGVDASTMELLVFWLARKELPRLARAVEKSKSVDVQRSTNEASEYHRRLARLWMLGNGLQMPQMQDCAMEEIIGIMSVTVTPKEAIRDCYALGRGRILGQVYVDEARHEYFDSRALKMGEMEQLADIPGFLWEFAAPIFAKHQDCGDDDTFDSPSSSLDFVRRRYMLQK